VSLTPKANFATSSAGVVDTGGKFAIGVKDTSGKFVIGVINARWLIATGKKFATVPLKCLL
jgi:hypothetical protein